MSENKETLSRRVRITSAASAPDPNAPKMMTAGELSDAERELQLSGASDPDHILATGKSVKQLRDERNERITKQRERVLAESREMTERILGDVKSQEVHVIEGAGTTFGAAVPAPPIEETDTGAELDQRAETQTETRPIPTPPPAGATTT